MTRMISSKNQMVILTRMMIPMTGTCLTGDMGLFLVQLACIWPAETLTLTM
jgi:hypothetical protein